MPPNCSTAFSTSSRRSSSRRSIRARCRPSRSSTSCTSRAAVSAACGGAGSGRRTGGRGARAASGRRTRRGASRAGRWCTASPISSGTACARPPKEVALLSSVSTRRPWRRSTATVASRSYSESLASGLRPLSCSMLSRYCRALRCIESTCPTRRPRPSTRASTSRASAIQAATCSRWASRSAAAGWPADEPPQKRTISTRSLLVAARTASAMRGRARAAPLTEGADAAPVLGRCIHWVDPLAGADFARFFRLAGLRSAGDSVSWRRFKTLLPQKRYEVTRDERQQSGARRFRRHSRPAARRFAPRRLLGAQLGSSAKRHRTRLLDALLADRGLPVACIAVEPKASPGTEFSLLSFILVSPPG